MGWEAFEKFFTALSPNSGMAFVLIQHLDPKRKSILSELIRNYTDMKVFEAEDGKAIEPNHVYIIPPNKDLAIMNGNLQLMESVYHHGIRTPIDYFFRTLAEDQQERAIGIVLSGTGSEGSQGLKAIKAPGRTDDCPGPREREI